MAAACEFTVAMPKSLVRLLPPLARFSRKKRGVVCSPSPSIKISKLEQIESRMIYWFSCWNKSARARKWPPMAQRPRATPCSITLA